MLISAQYDEWHKKFGGGTNFHGLFNGMNLTGADAARFFVEQKANPDLQFSQFIASPPVYFKVTSPSSATPDFAKRHPWIARPATEGGKSWEISFSATGLPVAFTPSRREVTGPVLTSVRPSTVPHRYLTRGLVTGEGARVRVAVLREWSVKLPASAAFGALDLSGDRSKELHAVESERQ